MSIVNEWPMVKLGDLGRFISGGTPNRKRPEFYEGSIPWISSADLSDTGKISTRRSITEEAIASSATKLVPDHTILIATRIGVGKVAITSEEMCFSQDIVALVDIDEAIVSSSFLKHMILIARPYLQGIARGVTIKGISTSDLQRLELPLPPLDEQQRIAEILDTVATTISSSREQLVALSQIQENLLTETDQVKYVPLGDLAQIRSGTVKPNEHPYCDLPHVAPDNIESGTGRLQGINTASEDGVTSNKYAFCAGDLLYSKIRPYLNKFAIPQFDGVCSADMYALVPQEPATAEYLAMTLQSPLFLAYAEQQSGRASIPKINRKSLTAFPVPFHSKAEIQRVTEIYQETETARSAVERKLDTLQELQNSLSTRAFAGQL